MTQKKTPVKKDTKPRAPRQPKPKDQVLVGMEDSAIKPLENAAHAYADIRDQRQALTREEVELKGKLLALMKQYEKSVYKRDGITIEIVTEEESVRVKVKKETEDDGDLEPTE